MVSDVNNTLDARRLMKQQTEQVLNTVPLLLALWRAPLMTWSTMMQAQVNAIRAMATSFDDSAHTPEDRDRG